MNDQIFPATRERVGRWQSDSDVLGVVWVGSRSRGHGDALSDDDLEVLLTDEAAARLDPADCSDVLIEGEGDAKRMIYDAQLLALSALEAKVDSPRDLDHWPYERAPILFDRDGRTALAVRAAGAMGQGFRHARLRHAWVDALGATRRATKTLGRGAPASSRLLISRAVRAFSRIVFALEGRWVPLDHWWEAELRTLADPLGVGPRLIEALVTGTTEPLEVTIKALEPSLKKEGLPIDRPGVIALFMELIHPENVAERSVHAL